MSFQILRHSPWSPSRTLNPFFFFWVSLASLLCSVTTCLVLSSNLFGHQKTYRKLWSILLYLQGAQGFTGWDWAIEVQTLVFSFTLASIGIKLRWWWWWCVTWWCLLFVRAETKYICSLWEVPLGYKSFGSAKWTKFDLWFLFLQEQIKDIIIKAGWVQTLVFTLVSIVTDLRGRRVPPQPAQSEGKAGGIAQREVGMIES